MTSMDDIFSELEGVRESLEIVMVEHVDDVLNVALHAEKREEPSRLAVAEAGSADRPEK